MAPTTVAPLSNPNFPGQNQFLIFISTASSNFFLYIKIEVIFGEDVQRVHTSTHTHTHTHTHPHTHTHTHKDTRTHAHTHTHTYTHMHT